MPGLFSKLLSPPCKQKDISSEKITNILTRTLAGSPPSCSPTLWGTEEGGKYGCMGKVWVYEGKLCFQAYLCFFLFFFTSLGLCVTPDLSMSRNGAKDTMIWEDEDKMTSVSESHENSWSHYILLVHRCSPWHPQREEVREKGWSKHPKKMWWEALNTIHFFLPCPTESFTLTPLKKETLPFLHSFLEHFTVRSLPKPFKPASLSLF